MVVFLFSKLCLEMHCSGKHNFRADWVTNSTENRKKEIGFVRGNIQLLKLSEFVNKNEFRGIFENEKKRKKCLTENSLGNILI